MSNRRCNYCDFQQIKRNAEKTGMIVEVRPNKKFELGGVDIYVNGSFVAWFMELPESCRC